MKNAFRTALVGIFVLFTTMVFAQQSENRTVTSFNAIKASGIFEVILQQGNDEALKIEATNIELNKIVTRVSENTLILEMEKREGNNWNPGKDIKVKVYITFEQLNSIENSGVAEIKANSPIKTDKLNLQVSGAGNVKLDLDVADLTVKVSGAGNMELKGRAQNQQVSLSGAGNIRADELKGESVEVSLSGAGNAEVYASKSITAKASGVGHIRYKGNPAQVKISESGFGKVSAQ